MQLQTKKLTLVSQGSNSEIYRYGSKEKGVVLKMVACSCVKESRHLSNEYEVLVNLNHENIIKALKYKQGMMIGGKGGSKQLCVRKNVLVMENACHGSLLDFYRVHPSNANQTRWICSELCEAVRYLHCNYIVHRDIKLDNVLVSQNLAQIQIKLADFGFATNANKNSFSNALKGTRRGYMAPEIHNLLTAPDQEYDMFKADIFALGVLMFSIVFGILPFEFATPTNSHYMLICQQNYNQFWKMHMKVDLRAQQMQDSLVQDFKTIFQLMVQEDATKRPSIQEVLECEWFSGKQEIIHSIQKQPDCTN